MTNSGPVVSVPDGDTLDVLHNGKAERIRRSGIDCSAKGQAYGQKAKHAASDLAIGKKTKSIGYAPRVTGPDGRPSFHLPVWRAGTEETRTNARTARPAGLARLSCEQGFPRPNTRPDLGAVNI